MASSHQEPDSKLAIEQDQFNRLPNDLVLLIINKLLHAKTLIRLSLVSKLFFPLVFQTDSIFVDLKLLAPSFLEPVDCFPNSNSQKLSDILQDFQQIKNLHVSLCVNPSADKPMESGTSLRSVAAFGSHFEFYHLLIAESLNQSNPSVVNGIDVMQDLSNEDFEHVLTLLISSLNLASMTHDLISGHVLERKMLESVVFSDNCEGRKVIMGKKQIARLRSNQEVSAFPIKFRVFARYVPTLDLLKLGYTMNKLTFVWVTAVKQNVEVKNAEGAEVINIEPVKVMDTEGVEVMNAERVEVMGLPVLDHSDSKQWEVFYEAIQLLADEIKVKMSVS